LYGQLKEREMDLTGWQVHPGCMNRIANTCPCCGWPTAEPFQVVSRHVTSEGMITWSRCACGRLQVHRGGALVLRATGTARPTQP
jgi:hypothetical protein